MAPQSILLKFLHCLYQMKYKHRWTKNQELNVYRLNQISFLSSIKLLQKLRKEIFVVGLREYSFTVIDLSDVKYLNILLNIVVTCFVTFLFQKLEKHYVTCNSISDVMCVTAYRVHYNQHLTSKGVYVLSTSLVQRK